MGGQDESYDTVESYAPVYAGAAESYGGYGEATAALPAATEPGHAFNTEHITNSMVKGVDGSIYGGGDAYAVPAEIGGTVVVVVVAAAAADADPVYGGDRVIDATGIQHRENRMCASAEGTKTTDARAHRHTNTMYESAARTVGGAPANTEPASTHADVEC